MAVTDDTSNYLLLHPNAPGNDAVEQHGSGEISVALRAHRRGDQVDGEIYSDSGETNNLYISK